MRRLFFILITTSLLAACTGNGYRSLDGQAETRKKPSIPEKPKAFAQEIMKADILEVENKKDVKNGVDIAHVVEQVNESLGKSTISSSDIERGWYFGNLEDKKTGTPDSWLFVDDGINSRWSSPGTINEVDEQFREELCGVTGGTYVSSCIEEDVEGCEYIAENECRCAEQSKWMNEQGCVVVDAEGEFIEISDEELKQGWYLGMDYEKKLNTPLNWVWVTGYGEARWQNPSPKR